MNSLFTYNEIISMMKNYGISEGEMSWALDCKHEDLDATLKELILLHSPKPGKAIETILTDRLDDYHINAGVKEAEAEQRKLDAYNLAEKLKTAKAGRVTPEGRTFTTTPDTANISRGK